MNEQSLRVVQSPSHQTNKKVVHISNFHVWIEDAHILNDVNLNFPENEITCIIGPSGGGKSTLIRSINRINDDIDGLLTKGKIEYRGEDILDKNVDPSALRNKIGMVFQKPCVFPKSISENVLFGIKHLKKLSKSEKLELVEENLKAVSLWKEVSHRLQDPASSLSIGQQQRLCIARALAVKPELILLDEPTSSLDPISTRAIEDMMLELKHKFTIIFVTHNIKQAKRIADHLVFLCDGKIIEEGSSKKMFSNALKEETKHYLKEEYCAC